MFHKLILQMKHPPDKYLRLPKFSTYQKLLRCVSDQLETNESDSPVDDSNQDVRKITSNKRKHIDPEYIDQIDPKILRTIKKPSPLYLLNKKTAKDFASLIVEDLIKMNTFMIELNPGLGFLTTELIESGVKRLCLYEANPQFINFLEPLVQKYPNRLELRQDNILERLPQVEANNRLKGLQNTQSILSGIEHCDWSDEKPSMVIIGSITLPNFFYYLLVSISHMYLSHYGRIILYAAILPSMTLIFNDTSKMRKFHRSKNIQLQTLFDCKVLGSVSRSSFFPWDSYKPKSSKEYYHDDKKIMHVCKIEAKRNFFNDDFSRQDFLHFYYFLSLHMNRSKTRIIPELEKWIPECGPRLIRRDFTIYTQFSDLTASELLDLFKLFKSWPEYESSSFIEFVESLITNRPEKS